MPDNFSLRSRLRIVALWTTVALLAVSPAVAQVQPPKLAPPVNHYEAARAAVARGDTNLGMMLLSRGEALLASRRHVPTRLLEQNGEAIP